MRFQLNKLGMQIKFILENINCFKSSLKTINVFGQVGGTYAFLFTIVLFCTEKRFVK